jgi:hypothetical protein
LRPRIASINEHDNHYQYYTRRPDNGQAAILKKRKNIGPSLFAGRGGGFWQVTIDRLSGRTSLLRISLLEEEEKQAVRLKDRFDRYLC